VPTIVATVGVGAAGPVVVDRSLDFSIAMPLKDLAILAACLALGIYGGRRIRLPAAHLTGPLILSAIAHYTGLTTVNPPQILLVIAQIVIGTSVAQFFSDTGWRQIAAGLAIGGGLTVINLGVASIFALSFQTWLDVPFAAGLMALVPGGLPEMSLVSIALGLDAAFVSVHHLFRIILILILLPVLVPLWAGKPTEH
jgi:membrane AbrB-like protein